jgi:hypothetical protein
MSKNPGPSPLVFPSGVTLNQKGSPPPSQTLGGVPGTLVFAHTPQITHPQSIATAAYVSENTKPDEPVVKRNTSPTSVFNISQSDRERLAIDTARLKFPDLFATSSERIERQIMQLLPLELATVMSWSANTISKMSVITAKVSSLARDFTQTDAATLIDETLTVLKKSSNTSILGVIKRKGKSVQDYIPRLKVLQTQMVQWLPLCQELLDNNTYVQLDLGIKMVALSVAIDSSNHTPDASLYVACSNRRILCQQSVQQSQLVALQIKQLQQQLVDITSRVDQLVQITIPAFLNATNQ